MLLTAQQMLQDSRTKIELLRMQIVKVSQVRGERDGTGGTFWFDLLLCHCPSSGVGVT